jgi:hypothetical protein
VSDLAGFFVEFQFARQLHVQAEVVGDDPDPVGVAGFLFAQIDRAPQVSFQHRDIEFGRGELGPIGAFGGGAFSDLTCAAEQVSSPSAEEVLTAKPCGRSIRM